MLNQKSIFVLFLTKYHGLYGIFPEIMARSKFERAPSKLSEIIKSLNLDHENSSTFKMERCIVFTLSCSFVHFAGINVC